MKKEPEIKALNYSLSWKRPFSAAQEEFRADKYSGHRAYPVLNSILDTAKENESGKIDLTHNSFPTDQINMQSYLGEVISQKGIVIPLSDNKIGFAEHVPGVVIAGAVASGIGGLLGACAIEMVQDAVQYPNPYTIGTAALASVGGIALLAGGIAIPISSLKQAWDQKDMRLGILLPNVNQELTMGSLRESWKQGTMVAFVEKNSQSSLAPTVSDPKLTVQPA